MANDQGSNNQLQQPTDSSTAELAAFPNPSDDRYQAIFTLIGQGFHISELIYNQAGEPIDWRYLEVNPAFEQQTGLHRVVGRLGSEVAPNTEPYWLQAYHQVLQTGEPRRVENYNQSTGRWYTAHTNRVGQPGSTQFVVLFEDITERKRREANTVFLAEVDQDLLRLTDFDQAMTVLGEKVGAYLDLSACAFVKLQQQAQIGVINYGWHRADIPSLLGTYRMDEFVTPEVLRLWQAGEAVIIRDVFTDPRTDGPQYAGLSIGSFVSMPLVLDGEWRFLLVVYRREAHDWRPDEIDLLRELTSRIWTRLERARAEATLKQREEQYRLLSIASSDSIYKMSPDWTQMRQLVGKTFLTDTLAPNSSWLAVYIPEEDQPNVQQVIQEAIHAKSTFELEHRVRLQDGTIGWTFSRAIPVLDEQGIIVEWLGAASDITARKRAEEALRQSEQRFRLMANSVPQAIWVTDAQGNTEFLNQWWINYSGIPFEPSTAWQIAADILHPEDGPRLVAAFQQAMQTGTPFEIEQRNRSASGKYRWFLNRGEPYRDPQTGQITKWVGISVDIHDRKMAEHLLQQSEARFRSLIEEAPVATCLLVGRELRIDVANEAMLGFWGKGPWVLGQPLGLALPKLEAQPFLTILDQVFTTGQTYTAHSTRADLEVDGVVGTYYFDLIYKPLRNAAGEVYAILNMATDVTQQVKTQQSLLESESSLRAMIDLAELGRYTIDLATNSLIKSPRLAQWYGLPEHTTVAASLGRVEERDQERVYQLFADALREGSSGVYDAEYGVISAKTGQRRLLRTTGQVRYGADGQLIRVDGLVIDLTPQRELQWKLEEQVNQRTQELAIVNATLQTTNQQMVLSNQALAQANQDLHRSNDNLQQFAYIASHDLQEPLRKIQSFSTLLKQQFADHLSEIGQDYLQRITGSAARMSTLIKDLLSYSRIATRQQAFGPLSLAAVVASVLDTLSLEIEERQAQIQVDELPVVNGDGSQLSQLFQNLLSNALKFTPAGRAPQVQVEYVQRQVSELPPEVRPNREAPFYHQISVRDQGVGFNMKYLDRIFQVFQRLHGKNEFAGTGVGLAICQRVVENHGGGITASSEPGQGATFCVYLPA